VGAVGRDGDEKYGMRVVVLQLTRSEWTLHFRGIQY
jgi:hypothetical protein